jgi:uncharacterized protein YceK
MRFIKLCLLVFILSGCSSFRHPQSPEFGGVTRKLSAVEQAAERGDIPAVRKQVQALKDQLESAQAACESQASDYDRVVKEANDWKAKQRKALKELWIYRGAIIALILFLFRNWIFGGLMFIARKFVGIPW